MKKFVRLLLVCAALPAIPHSAWSLTEWQVGRGAVTLQLGGGVNYDSNIQGAADGDSDVYFNLAPTARYSRKDSLIISQASLSAGAERYLEHDGFDNETYAASYTLSLPATDETPYGFAFDTGYSKTFDADPILNERVLANTFSVSLAGEVTLARMHRLNADIDYSNSSRGVGSDQKILGYGPAYSYLFNDGTSVGASYRHQETVSGTSGSGQSVLDQSSDSVAINAARPLYAGVIGNVSLGYRWLDRGEQENVGGLDDTDGYTFSAGLRGEFLPKRYFPKTTGTFRIGYENAVSPGLNDQDSRRVVGNVAVTWQARDTTSVRLGVSRSQRLTITDQTTVENGVEFALSQQITHFVTGRFDLGYTESTLPTTGRTDDRYTAGTGIAYQINLSWSAGFNYQYVNSSSSLGRATYDRHTAKLSATYAF